MEAGQGFCIGGGLYKLKVNVIIQFQIMVMHTHLLPDQPFWVIAASNSQQASEDVLTKLLDYVFLKLI